MANTQTKKFTAFMSVVAMVLSMLLYFPGGTFGNISFGLKASAATITLTEPSKDGNGVYQIGTAAELYWFADKVNNDNGTYGSANAVLTADITVNTGVLKSDGTLADDTSGFTNWTPIGWYDSTTYESYPYTGTFDGQRHTISGLYCNDEGDKKVGLFGRLSGGSVSNVGVVDSYFSGCETVGGVCGEAFLNATITNCYSTSTVTTTADVVYIGGVCGLTDTNVIITNCYNTGTVSGLSGYVGGVCGNNSWGSRIKNCYNTGAVTATGDNNTVGGVCGYNYWGSRIENCYNTGTISGKATYFGGVCGVNDSSTIKNCYYDSTVYSGNAVGYNNGTVTNVEGKPTADFTNCTVCELVGFDKFVEVNASGVYEISNACQLYWFAQQVNGGKRGINAVLTANITVNQNVLVNGELNANLTNPREWSPIGYYETKDNGAYTGTFDGQGHTISGLYFNDEAKWYVGLFGHNSGTIKNVGVVDSYIKGSSYVGGVCGWNDSGTITNCYNTGTVSGIGNVVGGVCGANNVTLSNNATITNCYNTGTVSGTGDSVGGVCGWNYYDGIITNCYNTGEVSGSDNAGGVCRNSNCGTITNCYYLAETADENGCKTETQFNSGEVAYLLSQGVNGSVWGQDLSTANTYPVLDGTKKVYQNENYPGCEMNPGTLNYTYSNTVEEPAYGEHSYDTNGFCQHSSEVFYQPATETTDKYDINSDNVKDKVYEIFNAGQLYWLADKVKNEHTTYKNANAVLTADITVNTGVLQSDGTLADDTSGFKSWTPIGYSDLRIYTGIFDGQGHTVSGLYFNDSSTNFVGLFGCAGTSSSVSNVGVVDSYFNGNNNVGGVCGYSNGKITNCYNQATVNGYGYVGGVCGEAGPGSTSKITNCYNVGIVKGKSNTACVVGYADSGKVSNCYYYGEEAKVTTPVVTSPVFPTDPIIPFITTTTYRKISIPSVFATTTTTVTTTKNINSSTTSEAASTTQSPSVPTEATGDEHATPKTAEQFASGEVAYLLNGSTSEGTLVWGQLIGEDDFPVLDSTKKVYQVERHITCLNVDEIVYSNTDAPIYLDHNYDENGFCQHDSEVFYQPATLTTNNYDLNNDNVKDEVYEISNTGQLYWFAGLVNGTLDGVVQDRTANAVLTADITVNTGDAANCNGTKETGWIDWTPINAYRGIFDGQGHTISGLYFSDSTTEDVGLFGLNYGTVQNVGVINSYFMGQKYVGGVCGENYKGTITNCYNTGTVGASSHFGGVCGYNYGTITNCYNRGTVNGSFYMGGEFSGVSYFGGVCGYNNFGTITNCYYDGDKYKLYAVGYNNGGTVSKNVLCQTTEQFNSGEVAYLLSQGCTVGETTYGGSIWGQTLTGTSKQDYPVLGGAKVYQIDVYEGCEVNPGNASTGYANTNAPVYAEHSMTEHSANAATCTVDGNYAYWTCSYENGVYYKDKAGTDKFANLEATVIPALEHEDTDNDGYCDNGCGKPVRSIVKEVSATLNGDIGLNYYIALPESVTDDTGAYVQFTVNGQNTKVFVKDLTAEENGTYKFTCCLTAKEMRDDVTFKLYDGNGTNVDIYSNSGEKIEGASFDYSLAEYFDALSSDENVALKDLADATLVYGAYAQNAFNHNADPALNGSELADVTVDTLETNKMTKSADIPEGLKLTEMTLILETETALRLYFKSDNIENYTFKLDGTGVTLNKIEEEGLYYVEIANISAKDLDTMHTLEINGECTLTFNALSYAYAVIKTGNNDNLCNVVKALYKYNEAANAYFGN